METKTFGDKKLTISAMSAKDLKCAKEYLDFINSLIAEKAKILMNVKQKLKDEQKWVENAVKAVRAKKKVFIVARDGDKIVADTSVELGIFRRNHVGKFAIAIRDGYRGIGLGSHIMKEVLKLAKKELPGLKLFQLEVYENNKPAIALYKKMGFKEVGKIPKVVQYKNKLIGEYIMTKPA